MAVRGIRYFEGHIGAMFRDYCQYCKFYSARYIYYIFSVLAINWQQFRNTARVSAEFDDTITVSFLINRDSERTESAVIIYGILIKSILCHFFFI